MRLSEAIRLGAMLKPQTTGHYRKAGATCALGAAADAAGIKRDMGNKLFLRFPILSIEDWPEPPVKIYLDPWAVDTHNRMSLYTVIWRLNDDAELTREQIADYVATIEARHDTRCAQYRAEAEAKYQEVHA